MAFDLSFSDFDTVCYNNQHNIIQLINKCVGLTVEFNLALVNITQLQDSVGKLEEDVGPGGELDNVANNLHDLQQEVRSMQSDLSDAYSNARAALALGRTLETLCGMLEERIEALENAVF